MTPLRRAPQGGPGPTQAVQIQAPRGEVSLWICVGPHCAGPPRGGPGPTQAVQIQAPRGEREKGEGEEEDKGRREKGRKG